MFKLISTGVARTLLASALGLALAPSAFAASVAVSPTNATAGVGGGATSPSVIAVQFGGDGVTAGFEAEIMYNTAVLDVSVAGQNGAGCVNNDAAGRVTMQLVDPGLNPLPAGPTTVCNLTFTVAAGQADGTVLPLTVQNALYSNNMGAPSPGPHSQTSGAITIQSAPTPLTLSYAPAAGTNIAFAAGAAVGGTAPAQQIAATAAGNQGTASLSGCAITGAGAAAFSVTPPSLNFAAAGTQNLSLGCTYPATNATATLTCSETDADSNGVARTWPLSCPAPTVNPTIGSNPASGSTITVPSGVAGGLSTSFIDLTATGGSGAGSTTISCTSTGNVRIAAAPGTPGSTGPVAQTVTGSNQPTDLNVGVILTTVAQSPAGTITCTVSGQPNLTYTVNAPAGVTVVPPAFIPSSSTWSTIALLSLLSLFGLLAVGFRRQL